MAKRIEQFTNIKNQTPWKDWTSGAVYQAELNSDYQNPRTFKSRLYHYAARNKLTVRVQQVSVQTIEFQFSKKTEKRAKRMKQVSK